MKTSDILINAANDAFFALCELDRDEANRILDESTKLYDAAPEKIEHDIFSGSLYDVDKPMILADFISAVTEACKKRWVASLADAEALINTLKSVPSANAYITIAHGVSLNASDIECITKEAKTC